MALQLILLAVVVLLYSNWSRIIDWLCSHSIFFFYTNNLLTLYYRSITVWRGGFASYFENALVKQFATREALAFPEGGTSYTFEELNDYANDFARWAIKEGMIKVC